MQIEAIYFDTLPPQITSLIQRTQKAGPLIRAFLATLRVARNRGADFVQRRD
jgi:hypothetical protein